MRVDFRGVQESSGGFEPLPPGEYLCRVRGAEEKTNYLQIEFEVLDEAFAGRKVVDRLFPTEKALPRLKMALSALGVAVDGLVEIEPRDLIGRQAYLSLEADSYTDRNGVFRRTNKVAYEGYRSFEPAPARPARPAPQAAPPRTARPGGFHPQADKDIPF